MNPPISHEELYLKYKATVYSYIYARVSSKEDAEDLTNEVFLKLFKALETFDGERAKVSTLIYKISYTKVIDYYRTQKNNAELDEKHGILPSAEDLIIDKERFLELLEAVSELPQDQRDIIILRFYKNWTLKKIAEEMGLTYNMVVSRQEKAFNAIKNKLSRF